jgi:transposase
MVAVALTRDEHTAGDLRRFAAACREAAAARRMLALALVLEGSPRAVAAKTCGMDRQTLRDWVHRYNAAGLDGLLNRREASAASRSSSGGQTKQESASRAP